MKVVDLTHTLENGMAVYPGAPEPNFEQVGSVAGGDIYQLIKFGMTTHTGTHLDTQRHVMNFGYSTEEQDMGFFIGKGVCLDCTKYEDGAEMGMEIFDGINMEGVNFVLLYCDWAKYWGQEKFFGNYPVVSKEVIEYLANNPDNHGLGVEYAAIDKNEEIQLPLHKAYLCKEKTVIENLMNLDQLVGKDFTFVGLPLKFKCGDGSPIRAVALINE